MSKILRISGAKQLLKGFLKFKELKHSIIFIMITGIGITMNLYQKEVTGWHL